jgi:hypothetical protein
MGNELLAAAFILFGIFGPPAFLLWAWLSWRKAYLKDSAPHWRTILRDVALCGATLEWITYWVIFFWIARYQGAEVGRAFELWGSWARIEIICSMSFIVLAVLAKGKGRILTILSCVGLVFALLAVNP